MSYYDMLPDTLLNRCFFYSIISFFFFEFILFSRSGRKNKICNVKKGKTRRRKEGE